MPLEKLSRSELAALRGGGGGRAASGEYAQFLQTLHLGEGGRAIVATEGVSRQSVKNRLTAASKATGISIAYLRSAPEEIVFEVVEAGAVPRRRGRPPKAS